MHDSAIAGYSLSRSPTQIPIFFRYRAERDVGLVVGQSLERPKSLSD